jgi:hypothetical protein
MKITRRMILTSAVPALAVAQSVPAPATALAASPDYIAISAAQYKRNAEAIAKVPVPIETEPAFHFKP